MEPLELRSGNVRVTMTAKTKPDWHIPLAEAAQRGPIPPNLAAALFKRGSMLLEYYAPRGEDAQTPHAQDELYFIAAGSARFARDGEEVLCVAGDALFVPAGMEHRFSEMSGDFATWVVFYGPEGGEQES